MSLDVTLYSEEYEVQVTCECCGHPYTEMTNDYHFTTNITHNLSRMADEAGLYQCVWRPEELGITRAGELAPLLVAGITKLKTNPAHYKKFNPQNGWGNYEGLLSSLEDYLAACELYPDVLITVSR